MNIAGYAAVAPRLLDVIAEWYGLSPAALTPVVGGNSSYVYEYARGERMYILCITPPDADIDLLIDACDAGMAGVPGRP